MQHVVFLTALPYYKVYLERLERKVTSDSVFKISQQNYTGTQDLFTSPPFFSKYYIVEAEVTETGGDFWQYILKLAKTSWVRLVFCVGYMATYRRVCDVLSTKGYAFTVFNCYKLANSIKQTYIQAFVYKRTKQTISNTLCDTIIRRSKGTEYNLDGYLEILCVIGISNNTVRGVIHPTAKIRLRDIPMNLFLHERSKILSEQIYRYRYNSKLLYETFMEFFKEWELLYIEYREGRFTPLNYLEWINTHSRSTTFNIHSEYTAECWLRLFNMYSYRTMYELKYKISEIDPRDWFTLITKLYYMSGVIHFG